MRIRTLDDVDFADKAILVRVDINSPIDPETGEILDDTRIRMCSDTLEELSKGKGKVIVIAHQGRPGGKDFTTLEKHARLMDRVIDVPVHFAGGLFDRCTLEAVSKHERGEILLLENVRFYSEEVINKVSKEQAKTHLVRKLSPYIDLFVNDAFAAAHRSQPSLVGFGVVLPSVVGRLMEWELNGLEKARSPKHPCVYVLGGIKIDDSISLAKHLLEREIADFVLTGGQVGHSFLYAKDQELGDPTFNAIVEGGYESEIERARKMLSNYGEKIKVPQDFRAESEKEKSKDLSVDDLPSEFPIYDIGDETIEHYSEIIREANTVVANGPLGVFERPEFARGTVGILKAMAKSKAFTMIGGGHLVAAATEAELVEKIDHVSTGGGAFLSFLSGEELPVIEVLKSAKKVRK